jgi:DNA-binding beta-propeller fold protein YncE
MRCHIRFRLAIQSGTLLCFASFTLFVGCERPALFPNGVVGVFGSLGLGDGDFHYPRAIAAEPSGSVFVVDKTGRIQRFSADGTFELSWHMPEYEKGMPVGMSLHPDGRLFVADTHYHRVVVFDRDGNQLAAFGELGMGPGQFQLPTDIAFDAEGNIYVGEYTENDRITKWSPDLEFVQVIGGEPIEGKPLNRPAGVIVDDEQTLWVADACNHRLLRFTLDGELLMAVGHFGNAPGEMRYPYDLCLTPDKSILVCEYEGNRLQWFSKDGRSLRTWGESGREVGQIFAPWGATYGPGGRIYVVDSLNNRVQIVRP